MHALKLASMSIVFGLGCANASFAQSAAQGQVCVAASQVSTAATEDNWAILRTRCRVGDIIFVPANAESAILKFCDFTKTIYLTPRGTALCVMAAERTLRQ